MVHFAVTIVLAAAGIASAQVVGIPQCALSCFATATTQSGCQQFDYFCQCTKGQATIQRLTTPCICAQCDAEEQSLVHQATQSICYSAFLANGLNYTLTPDTNMCLSDSTNNLSTSGSAAAASTAAASKTTDETSTTASAASANGSASSTPTTASGSDSSSSSSASGASSASSAATSATGNAAAPSNIASTNWAAGGLAAALLLLA